MRFTKACDYAMSLTTYLATLPEGETTNVKVVSGLFNMPERFLANIVNKLATSGIVLSQRGIRGGIRLARPGDQITVNDVISAIDGPVMLFDCLKSMALCEGMTGCSIQSFWDGLQTEIVQILKSKTLAELTPPTCPGLSAAAAEGAS